MEFENVNNFNLALEASLKKQKKMKFSTLVHRLKKVSKQFLLSTFFIPCTAQLKSLSNKQNVFYHFFPNLSKTSIFHSLP